MLQDDCFLQWLILHARVPKFLTYVIYLPATSSLSTVSQFMFGHCRLGSPLSTAVMKKMLKFIHCVNMSNKFDFLFMVKEVFV